jgi:BASS family bile acid:Na+ symporter
MQAGPELLEASIVTLVFSLGVRGVPGASSTFDGRPRLLLRAVILRDVLTPLVVMSVFSLLRLPPAATLGVVLLAISPGMPLLSRPTPAGEHANVILVASTTGVLLSMVSVPFWLAVVSKVFMDDASVAPLEVGRLIGVLYILPLAFGTILRRMAPATWSRASRGITTVANLLLFIVVAYLLGALLPSMRQLGVGFGLTVTVLAAFALVVGHIGGGRRSTNRSALALLCGSRWPGLALLIAQSNFAGDLVLPAVVASFLICTLVSLPYAYWQRVRIRAEEALEAAVPQDVTSIVVEGAVLARRSR